MVVILFGGRVVYHDMIDNAVSYCQPVLSCICSQDDMMADERALAAVRTGDGGVKTKKQRIQVIVH